MVGAQKALQFCRWNEHPRAYPSYVELPCGDKVVDRTWTYGKHRSGFIPADQELILRSNSGTSGTFLQQRVVIVRKHPKMFQLWGLSLTQTSYYDPRKY